MLPDEPPIRNEPSSRSSEALMSFPYPPTLNLFRGSTVTTLAHCSHQQNTEMSVLLLFVHTDSIAIRVLDAVQLAGILSSILFTTTLIPSSL